MSGSLPTYGLVVMTLDATLCLKAAVDLCQHLKSLPALKAYGRDDAILKRIPSG